MRFIVTFFILMFSTVSIGQQGQTDTTGRRIIKGEMVAAFIDSLKQSIIADTVNFRRTDLVHTNLGTRNTRAYSPVYLVDMKYAYKLDIINGTLVKEFLDNILDAAKIESIDILDSVYSQELFGINGVRGAILVTTRKKAKLNFKVAGLTFAKNKKRGDNFNQRQGNEIKIYD